MPLGGFHAVEGLLLRQRGRLILELDEGGRWRLDHDEDVGALLGARVRVVGVRAGFDLLEVSKLQRAGGSAG